MNVLDNYDMWLIHEAETERRAKRETEKESEDTDETE